jgi:hypothetical protein
MTRTQLLKRSFFSLGALSVLAVFATSGCAVQEEAPAVEKESSQGIENGIDLPVQETVDEKSKFYNLVSYDHAVSKFGVTVDKDAFGAWAGDGLIGFRFGSSGIFLEMSDGVPIDDREVVIGDLASEAS